LLSFPPETCFATPSKKIPQKQPKIRVSTPCHSPNHPKPLCPQAISLRQTWHSTPRQRTKLEIAPQSNRNDLSQLGTPRARHGQLYGHHTPCGRRRPLTTRNSFRRAILPVTLLNGTAYGEKSPRSKSYFHP
jgi:hypothetical protein